MLRLRLRHLLLLSTALTLAACFDDPDVMRRVTLTPALELPEGTATVENGNLIIAVDGLEALSEGTYVAWLEDGASGDVVSLGELEAGQLEVVMAEAPAVDSSIIVTEEAASADRIQPAGPVRLEGPVGGDLLFDPTFAAALSGSRGLAILHNDTAEIECQALPAPPEGMHYVAWADFSEGDGHHDAGDGHHDEPAVEEPHDDGHDGHVHKNGDHAHDEPAAEEPHDDTAVDEPHQEAGHDGDGMSRIGRLQEGRVQAHHHRSLAHSHGVIITLESEHGHRLTMSSIRALSGEVVLPEIETGGHAHTH